MSRLHIASSILVLATTLPVAADAFVVPPPALSSSCSRPGSSASSASCSSAPTVRVVPQLMMSNVNNNNDDVGADASIIRHDISLFGALGLAAAAVLGLASGGSSAMAAVPDHSLQPPSPPATATSRFIQSSSIHLSETIKTMDFSLPSSYDSISDAKSAATDELTVEVNPPMGSRASRTTSSGSSSKQASSSAVSSAAMTSEERAALKAARDAQKAADAAARAAAQAADKEAEAAAAAAKREAALAVKEAEKAEKAAQAKLKKEAEAEKEAKKAAVVSGKIEIVDMDLPSYGDSAKMEGKKSPFAL